MTRRRLRRTAMPQSWRPVTEHKVEQFGDVVITTEIVNPSRGSRYYNIYTYGQLFGTAHSLADAKYQVEVIYGPLQWHRQPNPPVEVIHYYFGRTTEFTEPTTIYTADLPMLGYAESRRAEATRRGVYGEQSTATHRRIYRGLSVPKPRGFQDRWLKLNFGTKSISEEEDFANWQRIAEQILRDIQSGRNEYWSEDQSVSIYFAKSLRHSENSIPILLTGWLSRGDESYAYTQSYDDRTTFSDEGEITLFDRQTVEVDGAYLIRDGGSASQPLLTLTLFSTQSPSNVIRMSAARRTASSNVIYRGFQVALPSHIEDAVRELNEPPMEEHQIGQHKHIGRILVDWLQDNHWESGIGLGRHWTRRHLMAEAAAMRGGAAGGWGIILTATYNPEDENPDLHNTTPSLAQSEDEVNLRPGAPLTITDVEIVGWNRSLIDSPIRATASRKTASKTYYHGTIWPLREGTELLPPSRSGKPANYAAGTGNPDTVYVTTDKAEAYWYGIISAVASGFPVIKPSVYEVTDLANSRDSTLYPGLETLADSGTIGRNVTDEAKHEFERFLADSKWQLVQDTAPHNAERFAPYLLARTSTRKTASKTYYRGISLFDLGGREAVNARNNGDMNRLRDVILSNLGINDVGEWWTPSRVEAEWFGGVLLVGQTDIPQSRAPQFPSGTPITLTDILVRVPDEPLPMMLVSDSYSWHSILDRPMQVTTSRKQASTSGPYYHGTPFHIPIGDTILPASKNLMGHSNFSMSRGDRIYLTNDIGEAYWWAAMASATAPMKVHPNVYRVDNVENPQVSSAMGQFELLAESAEVVEDVTEQAKAAWLAKGSNRYQMVVNMGGIEDTERNRGYFLIASRKTGVRFEFQEEQRGWQVVDLDNPSVSHTTQPTELLVGMYEGNDLAGQAAFRYHPDGWYENGKSIPGPVWAIANIYTEPEHRKKGYASELILAVAERYPDHNIVLHHAISDAGAALISKNYNNPRIHLGKRKTGNYLTRLDPHIQHPDTRYALNLISEALATLPDPNALNLAKQVRIYLAGKPNPDSDKEQAIQRFLIRYADKIIKSHGDQPAASVPNYHSRELQHAWDTLAPQL